MSEFKVKVLDMGTALEVGEGLPSILDSIADGVEKVRFRLNWEIAQKERISSRLKQASSKLRTQCKSTSEVFRVGRAVQKYYQDNEAKLLGEMVGEHGGGGRSIDEKDADEGFDWAEALREIVGETCVIGSGVSMLWGILSGDDEDFGTYMLERLKDLSGLVGKGAEVLGKKDDLWKLLTGMYNEPAKGLWGSIKDQLGKYDIVSSKGWGKVEAVAKWAGDVITVITTGFENAEEHGGIDSARFWGETIVESGLDIGLGFAVATAVGAVIGGPAIVVGAATAAVTIGVDWALDMLAGGDWKETVSDAVNDFAENVAEGAKNVAKAVGDGAKKAGKAIVGWAKSLFGG